MREFLFHRLSCLDGAKLMVMQRMFLQSWDGLNCLWWPMLTASKSLIGLLLTSLTQWSVPVTSVARLLRKWPAKETLVALWWWTMEALPQSMEWSASAQARVDLKALHLSLPESQFSWTLSRLTCKLEQENKRFDFKAAQFPFDFRLDFRSKREIPVHTFHVWGL